MKSMTKTQMHASLKRHGHALYSEESDAYAIDVSFRPETIITVGLNLDGSLKPAYRQRYFACVRDSNEVPLLLSDIAFALSEPFATAAKLEQANNYFMMGPLRWLLARIRPFERVLLWPNCGFLGADGLDFLGRITGGERIDQAPQLALLIERYVTDPLSVGAVVLDLSELADCRVLWEAANLVGEMGYDFYVADALGMEIYLMHHHDKLMISIPDSRRRVGLVEALHSCELLEDCSGFAFKEDEELGE